MTLPESTCVVLGCQRAVLRSEHGAVYNRCEAHVRALLSAAFSDAPGMARVWPVPPPVNASRHPRAVVAGG